MGLGGRDRRSGVGEDGDREEVVVGTAEMWTAGLVEMLTEGMERDLVAAAKLGLSQATTAEVIEEGILA